MDIDTGQYVLRGLERLNVVLGKNGCGKSTLLKNVSAYARSRPDVWVESRYITPERGGTLKFDQSIESNARGNPAWSGTVTERNQFGQFKQLTVYRFDRLQLRVLQGIADAVEAGATPPSRTYVQQVNDLLDNIEIREKTGDHGFDIYQRADGSIVGPEDISSGESELISLAVEVLAFTTALGATARGMLILDEPDVHLHPDLQARLMRFLQSLVETHSGLAVMIATHSTAIVGELSRSSRTTIAAMMSGQRDLRFDSIDESYRRVLPIFGAHPLTSVYREAPILLVEGTDEVRIWQQALRSSLGAIPFHPVDTGGLGAMKTFEDRVNALTSAVYDGARAYSIRDRDDGPEDIENAGSIVRMRLSCRSSENLMLSDDVLGAQGIDWLEAQARVSTWIDRHESHERAADMRVFANGGMDRRAADLKPIRMIVLADVLQTDRPWEYLVGKAIAQLGEPALLERVPGSLSDFLGAKICSTLREVRHKA